MLCDQIKELRNQGYSYSQISEKLGCSKSTISYHIGNGQKQKNAERLKKHRAKRHPFVSKYEHFIYKKTNNLDQKTNYSLTARHMIRGKINTFFRSKGDNMKYHKPTFSVDDVINKFGDNPSCYLTGQKINIHKPRTYEFDHIIPKSRGGDNSLENLGLCTKAANRAKHDMTPDEFINFCKQIVEHNS